MNKNYIVSQVFRLRHIANRGFFAGLEAEIKAVMRDTELSEGDKAVKVKEIQSRRKDWRDHLAEEHRTILDQFDFKVINRNTKEVKVVDAISFDGGLHIVPREQNNIDVEAELEYVAGLGK